MTIGEMKQAIKPREGMQTVIFRPINEYDFIELDAVILNRAFDELVKKIELPPGIVEITDSDRILFELFLAHAKYNQGGYPCCEKTA